MKVKVQGERWFPVEKSFGVIQKDYWGDWYCDSEVGTLRSILLRRPGKEVECITEENYSDYRFRGVIDPVKAREQQDAYAELLRKQGVTVHYVEEMRDDRPNAMFMRDNVLMTPEGAIISRQAMESRLGEERYTAQALANLGVPIIKTINGDGIFEGACAMWVDRETVVLGSGPRSNASGIHQVENELLNMKVTNIIHEQIPFGSIHLDGYMNMVDKKKIFVFPWHLSYDCAKSLLDLDIQIIEATDVDEVKQTMGMNFITLAPGKVIMPTGNQITRSILEKEGVEVLEVEIDEILKGWGALHCMSVFLKRDPLAQC
jgi:arginine deiminase